MSWLVLGLDRAGKSHCRDYLRARCSCGNVRSLRRDYLAKYGATKSCHVCTSRSHGMTRSPEHRIWSHMLARCGNPSAHEFARYGGRGIRVCNEWKGAEGFAAFYAHIGPRPSPRHSIDRVDNNGNYEPGNVRWATAEEQARNRRSTILVTIDGITMCAADWAKRNGIKPATAHLRIRKFGWDPITAVSEQPNAIYRRKSHGSARHDQDR